MDIQHVLLILRARWRTVLAVLAATVLLTVVACLVLPPRYAATASVLLEAKPDPVASVMAQSGLVPAINFSAGTETEIIMSERVARRVVRLLKLDEDADVQRDWREATGGKGRLDVWLGALLLKKVTVKQGSLQSNVLPIKFESRDAEFSAAVANAFAQAYVELSLERKVEPAKQYATWFRGQEQALRDKLEKAQTRLLRHQQHTGIVVRDEQLDDESAKLTQLTQQLSTVVGQNAESRSKEDLKSANLLPEVAASPVISGLRTDIGRAEAKLGEVSSHFGRNHPQYRRMEAELAVLRDKLRSETAAVTQGLSASGDVGRGKEAQLRAAIDAQKRKLLRLKEQREELSLLQREVDAARKAYDGVMTQLQQTTLDSQSTQANVFLLTPAVPPSEPSFPKLVLFTLLAFPLGLFLGAAAAYALEMLDRHVRAPAELGELELPVLGVIAAPRPAGGWLPWRRMTAARTP
jgi:chain length determinant protein EpsF